LFELYLAQYPQSDMVKDMARAEGIDSTPFPQSNRTDKCVLCGLCIRTCQELSVGAIAPLSRGTEKRVGPRPDMMAEDCTACGACAQVCPTGEIQMIQSGGKFHIWKRDFDIPLCEVEPNQCRGCGICEEVCPWDIPRIINHENGQVTAFITPTYCTGCGICAGACPTGAIKQAACPDRTLGGAQISVPGQGGRTVVFACSRSPFPPGTDGVIEVPCIGRVGPEHMLDQLARGADGVLLLCRDQATCPYGPGGQMGWERSSIVDTLCTSIGLGAGRIQCRQPPAGSDGPVEALEKFRTGLEPSPLQHPLNLPDEPMPGLDRALWVTAGLRARPELVPVLPSNLKSMFYPIDNNTDTLLYMEDLVDLNLLLSLLMKEWRLDQIFEDAAAMLRQRDIQARPVFTAREINTSSATRVVTFCPTGIPGLERAIETVTIGSLTGIKPSRSAKGNGQFRFQIGQAERRELVKQLQTPGPSLACDCPHDLAQYKLLTRQGVWLGPIAREPVMAFSEIVRLTQGDH
jgi:NAD-dependent dihydropyrimidine dehydrogenase PreA subunit/coenzyme F420-reducing hydrogenase delta subunit